MIFTLPNLIPIKIAKNIIIFENFKSQLFHDIVKSAFCLKSVKKFIETKS